MKKRSKLRKRILEWLEKQKEWKEEKKPKEHKEKNPLPSFVNK